jgi:hypothetical protein
MDEKQFFSTKEAADYLGYSGPQTVKYHVYTSRTLVPDATVGKSLLFTRETLDAFRAAHRPPGRPRLPDGSAQPASVKRRGNPR